MRNSDEGHSAAGGALATSWQRQPGWVGKKPAGLADRLSTHSIHHGGALATLVAGRRALLMLVVESTLLALAGRVNDDADGSRSVAAPARACSGGLPHAR